MNVVTVQVSVSEDGEFTLDADLAGCPSDLRDLAKEIAIAASEALEQHMELSVKEVVLS